MRWRTAWSSVVTIVVVLGLGAALLAWTGAGLVLTFLPAALVGLCLAGSLLPGDAPRASLLLRYAVLAGTAVVAVGGVADLLGPQAAALVMAAVGLSSPPALRWVRRRCRGGGPAVPAPPEEARAAWPATAGGTATAQPRPRSLRLMSDRELCDAWCSSYLVLQSPIGPQQCAHVVRLRQAYLDELERRHPDGVRRWLSVSARAASNPGMFLRGDVPRDRHID